MDIHILRDGKQTGPYSVETVEVLLQQGSILINDLAWKPGMPEWLPLHTLLCPSGYPAAGDLSGSEVRQIASTQDSEENVPDDVALVPTAPLNDIRAAAEKLAATPRQRAFLSYMDVPFKSDLTKEQAALLVNDAMECTKNAGKLKRWEEERLELYPDLFAEEIKARRENRAQQFLEICHTKGASSFVEVTKAHTQVLVGYLDVRFPNWDRDEHTATYDYFFPAISEKFPQLLTKAGKGRFKYPDGPRVAPELVRSVRSRPKRSLAGAVFRGLIFGALVLGVAGGAVMMYSGKLKLPFDLRLSSLFAQVDAKQRPAKKPASTASAAGTAKARQEKITADSAPATSAKEPNTGSTPSSSSPSSPDMAAAQPSSDVSAKGSSAALPESFSLFDAAQPAAATPVPVARPVRVSVGTGQPVMGRMNKTTLVALKFGTSTLRTGTPVQIIATDGPLLKIQLGPEVVRVPASNVDLPGTPATPGLTGP